MSKVSGQTSELKTVLTYVTTCDSEPYCSATFEWNGLSKSSHDFLQGELLQSLVRMNDQAKESHGQ